jgi:hypothetical protein
MEYLLHDLIRLPLAERLSIIERLLRSVNAVSTEKLRVEAHISTSNMDNSQVPSNSTSNQ